MTILPFGVVHKAGGVPEIPLAEFARLFPLRAPKIGFLLGAGASVTSGISSAVDMIWEFKKLIYAGDHQLHVKRLGSLADPTVRSAIQRHFDSQDGTPREGADSEYSYYFKRAFPDPDDRRLYVSHMVKDKQPHYGYLCLGALLSSGKVEFVWTPNFDTMAEQAYSIVSAGELASVVGRGTAAHLATLIRDRRFPVVVKLHGDFRVDPLQNTQEELSELDDVTRDQFVDFSGAYGIVAVGYSGRDSSVMNAIERGLQVHGKTAFPDGIYWCLRETDAPPSRATDLLSLAKSNGVRAAFVRISDWDDFATALYKACGLSHPKVDSRLDDAKQYRNGYILHRSGSAEPLLKLNSIPISRYPDSCFRFKADGLTSWRELREIVARNEIAAALWGKHVYALGSRTEIQDAFEAHGIKDLQPCPISETDLRAADSRILGMFYDALSRSLTVNPGLRLGGSKRHRQLYLAKDHGLPAELSQLFTEAALRAGRQVVRYVSRPGYWAHEAVEYALDYREGQLWLLISPTVVLTADGADESWENPARSGIVREYQVERHNRQTSALLTFWLRTLRHFTNRGTISFPPSSAGGFEFHLENRLGTSFRRS